MNQLSNCVESDEFFSTEFTNLEQQVSLKVTHMHVLIHISRYTYLGTRQQVEQCVDCRLYIMSNNCKYVYYDFQLMGTQGDGKPLFAPPLTTKQKLKCFILCFKTVIGNKQLDKIDEYLPKLPENIHLSIVHSFVLYSYKN